MVKSLSKFVGLGAFALIFLFLASALAEASYYTQFYGPSSYGNQGSGSASGSYLQVPRYPINYFENSNRNSFDFDRTFNQQNSRSLSNSFTEDLRSRNFGGNVAFDNSLYDVSDFGSNSLSGSQSESLSYTLGDGNTPTSRRVLRGNFRGKRNDFEIEEIIFGGEQVNFNRNNAQTFSNSAGFNNRYAGNGFNAVANFQDNNLNRNTANTLQETSSLSNSFTRQESSFGNGYQLVFNY